MTKSMKLIRILRPFSKRPGMPDWRPQEAGRWYLFVCTRIAQDLAQARMADQGAQEALLRAAADARDLQGSKVHPRHWPWRWRTVGLSLESDPRQSSTDQHRRQGQRPHAEIGRQGGHGTSGLSRGTGAQWQKDHPCLRLQADGTRLENTDIGKLSPAAIGGLPKGHDHDSLGSRGPDSAPDFALEKST